MKDMAKFSDFISEYKTAQEPSKQEKARNWDIAIGLQQVDGLTPSRYLYQVARDNIEGKLSHDEVHQSLRQYYRTPEGDELGIEYWEADTVSNRIAELLSNSSFTFAPTTLLSIHKYLFNAALPEHWVGNVRTKDIIKAENVLMGDTVHYASHMDIMPTLEYDFDREERFDYSTLNTRAQVEHIAQFVSGLWQIHPFREGNTRTIAVFAIKYLRNKGFAADNELFKDYAEYFRNALVRANYENIPRGIKRTYKYLNLFFGNLLLGENNSLKGDDMVINIANPETKTSDITSDKCSDLNIDDLNKTEQRFFIAMAEKLCTLGYVTAADAISITGKSPQRVRQLFVALVNKGFLVATGQNKGRKYSLPEKR